MESRSSLNRRVRYSDSSRRAMRSCLQRFAGGPAKMRIEEIRLLFFLKIPSGSDASFPSKGRYKGAGRFVTYLSRDFAHRFARAERFHRTAESNDRSPACEWQSGAGEESSGQRSTTGSDVLSPLGQRPLIGRVLGQHFRYLQRTIIRWHSHVKRHGRDRIEEVDQQLFGVRSVRGVQVVVVEVVEEVREEWCNNHRSAHRPRDCARFRSHVSGAHRRDAFGKRLVTYARRNPERTRGWQHPCLRATSHGEDATRGPRELMVFVCVPIEYGARGHGERAHSQSHGRID
jgi:hypothetical protein